MLQEQILYGAVFILIIVALVLVSMLVMPPVIWIRKHYLINKNKRLVVDDNGAQHFFQRAKNLSKYNEQFEQDQAKKIDWAYSIELINRIESGEYTLKWNRIYVQLPYIGTFREAFVESLVSKYNVAVSRGKIRYIFGIPIGVQISISFRR